MSMQEQDLQEMQLDEEVQSDGYIVVFEGTGQVGGHEGIRSWTVFRSKDKFEKWKREAINQDTVIAEGVTPERAIELVMQTSGEARARASFLDDLEEPDAHFLHFFNGFLVSQQEGTSGVFLSTYLSLAAGKFLQDVESVWR